MRAAAALTEAVAPLQVLMMPVSLDRAGLVIKAPVSNPLLNTSVDCAAADGVQRCSIRSSSSSLVKLQLPERAQQQGLLPM